MNKKVFLYSFFGPLFLMFIVFGGLYLWWQILFYEAEPTAEETALAARQSHIYTECKSNKNMQLVAYIEASKRNHQSNADVYLHTICKGKASQVILEEGV